MTGAFKLPKDIVGSLRPGDVQLYLTSRGWISEPFGKGGKGLRFHHPSIPQVDLLLPLKRELGDYIIRMAELVTFLATIEERPWSQVVKDLSGPSSDVFRFRIDAADATLGNLPLDEGIDLLRGSRDLLLAASCSALRPQPFHPRRLPKEVRGFLKSCRLGQTERGSFIATIIAPVPPALQRVMDFGDQESRLGMEPFPRRVTTRLMPTLGFVSDAIQAGNLGQILEGIDQGVSANFCDALQAIKPSGDQSRLEISVIWARSRGPVPASVPQAVSFPQESFLFIAEAGRHYVSGHLLGRRNTAVDCWRSSSFKGPSIPTRSAGSSSLPKLPANLARSRSIWRQRTSGEPAMPSLIENKWPSPGSFVMRSRHASMSSPSHVISRSFRIPDQAGTQSVRVLIIHDAEVCESTVESAALEWFESLAYNVLSGPQVVPGEPAAEGSQRAPHVSWCGRTWGHVKRDITDIDLWRAERASRTCTLTLDAGGLAVKKALFSDEPFPLPTPFLL